VLAGGRCEARSLEQAQAASNTHSFMAALEATLPGRKPGLQEGAPVRRPKAARAV
jgi:hypothetical protein